MGVLFKTHGCRNIQQLRHSASGAFFVRHGGGKKGGKEKEQLPHANIYKVISFNCTLLFNLPRTNAFKSGAGGILLKSCLRWTKCSWLLWPFSLALFDLTAGVIPFIHFVKHAMLHLESERQMGTRVRWACSGRLLQRIGFQLTVLLLYRGNGKVKRVWTGNAEGWRCVLTRHKWMLNRS